MKTKKVVLIEGNRTPFLKSGGPFIDLMSYQLGKEAIAGLLAKTGIDPKEIDQVVMGTVISNLRTSNVARESAISAGVPNSAPCHTVTQACISANRAIATAALEIMGGQADIVIAGGVDNTSDTPITFKNWGLCGTFIVFVLFAFRKTVVVLVVKAFVSFNLCCL